MHSLRTRTAQALALLALTSWPRGLVGIDTAGAEEFLYLGAGPLLGDRARQLRAATAPPADWTRPGWDDSAWAATEAAAAPPPDGGAADGGLPGCGGALYVRRRFDVGPELSRLVGLTLRVRYEDGFAAYVNGLEVARRRLPEAALTDGATLATERRPVGVESYYVAAAGLLRPRDNVLAIEVHPRLAGGCPKVTAELSAADGPHVVRGPYIERLDEGGLDLALETDVPTSLQVRYGRGAAPAEDDRRARDPGPATVHRLHLDGLRPATAYHYQVAVQAPAGAPPVELPPATFHTPPRAGRPLRFVVYGDSRSGHGTHAQVVQSILAEDPDLVLSTGDVVARGTEEGEWDRYFTVAAPLLRQVPVYLTPGNHEYSHRGQGARRLFELFSTMFPPQPIVGEGLGDPAGTRMGAAPAALPRALFGAPVPAPRPSLIAEDERGYYSFDAAGVHFVTLDSNQYRSPRQLRWLGEDLRAARARRARAIFVWTHAGPFSSGLHGDNADAVRDYVPLMARAGVTMVFSGHDHDFERGRRGGLPYLVTGGAGAELRPLRCGAPGKPDCPHRPAVLLSEHHYVQAEVQPGALLVCPKRVDGTPLEPCQRSALPLRR